MRYFVQFTGRKKNAIGLFYMIQDEVNAETPEEAVRKLYDTYEHIQVPLVREWHEDGMGPPIKLKF